jgi:mono/diheme cytochrome c family protein
MRQRLWLVISTLALCVTLSFAQDKELRMKKPRSGLASAPESAHRRVNPYGGKAEATLAGRKLFERHCAECHGTDARGRGKAPALNSGLAQLVPTGDLFWFLTNGNLWAGMPSWSRLPEAQRWQIVAYLKTLREQQTP